MIDMVDVARYLEVYDRQYRTARAGAPVAVAQAGPLHLITFARGHGFVTYRDLGGAAADGIDHLVSTALGHFREDPAIERVDWKTCAHDQDAGLRESLLEHGFTVGARESIMVGDARALAVAVELPAGVTLRRVTDRADVAAMEEMQGEVFDEPDWRRRVDVMMDRLATGDGMELWIAECAGMIISAGRIEPVAGTEFADLCGGATRVAWRRRGVYRALTAARARAAIAQGKSLLHSSSTEFSRPILQRAGLTMISDTTVYTWRAAGSGPTAR